MANSSTATVTIIISGFGIIIQVSSRDQSFSDSAQKVQVHYWICTFFQFLIAEET